MQKMGLLLKMTFGFVVTGDILRCGGQHSMLAGRPMSNIFRTLCTKIILNQLNLV